VIIIIIIMIVKVLRYLQGSFISGVNGKKCEKVGDFTHMTLYRRNCARRTKGVQNKEN